MPATEFHESPTALRRLTTTDGVHDGREQDLESFQKTVTDRLVELSRLSSDDLLSLTWIRQLLNSFECCLDEFRAILFSNRFVINKSPLDRFVNDFFERSVKALDVCNAIRDGIEHVREWKKFLEIVLCALDASNNRLISSDRSSERLESAGKMENTRPKINNRLICEGQFRRAKKALIELSLSMLDEKDSSNSAVSHRNRSFGRQKDNQNRSTVGHFRSMSWSVSRSWSAARQIQAIGNNLAVPRGNEVMASNGVVLAVYTMNCVLLFVMWCLVAAIPCQDRGLQVHFSIPRQFGWASAVLGLHERIFEESRKRERRHASGLLREIGMVDKFTRVMNELVDSVQFPLSEEKEHELQERVDELRWICERINEGLDPLERQVREVFCKIVHTRTEGLDSWGRSNRHD